jgi:hypothetical protein
MVSRVAKDVYPRIYVTERPIRQMAKDKRCYSEAAAITYRNKVSNRNFEPFEPKVFTPSCLGAFTLLAVPSIVSREPKCGKYQKADAGADCGSVVRPCRAQETRISVVPRRDDRDRLERRPAATAVVEHQFEHAVPVRDAECGAVQARLAIDGEEPGTDVRVEHGELELQIVQPKVGRPYPSRTGRYAPHRPVEGGWLRKQDYIPWSHQQEKTHDILVDGILFA